MVQERSGFLSRKEVQRLLGVEDEFLISLEREEIIRCDRENCYPVVVLERIRICQTLHYELGVNLAGLEVALNLLDTIAAERRQFKETLAWLRSQMEQAEKKS